MTVEQCATAALLLPVLFVVGTLSSYSTSLEIGGWFARIYLAVVTVLIPLVVELFVVYGAVHDGLGDGWADLVTLTAGLQLIAFAFESIGRVLSSGRRIGFGAAVRELRDRSKADAEAERKREFDAAVEVAVDAALRRRGDSAG